MQAEATLIERITNAYIERRGVRLICILALLSAAVGLFLLAGGFPPWSWRLLAQALMQLPALVAVHGQIVYLALVGLVLLALTVLLAYWALCWIAWRMLAYWLYERQTLRNFALDMAEAQSLAEERVSIGTSGELDEEEESTPQPVPAASRRSRRTLYPLPPLQRDTEDLEEQEETEEPPRTRPISLPRQQPAAASPAWRDSDKDIDFSQVASQALREPRPVGAGAVAFEQSSGKQTDNLQHSSYGRFMAMPVAGTAAIAPQPRFNTILYDQEHAPVMPPLISLPDGVARRSTVQLIVGTGLDVGLKRSGKPNEDSLLALQNTRLIQGHSCPVGLFAIADGMGGHGNGHEASRMAIQSLSKTIVPAIIYGPTDDNYAELLAEGAHHANLEIHQRNRQENADMGTTLAAVLVINTTAYIVNVGDSRVYLYRAASGLSQITRDHSTVARLVETGVIQPDEVYTHPRRNEIYRSLGHRASEDIDHFTLALQGGDLLFLCSDGLWEMVRDAQIKELIEANLTEPVQLSSTLIQAALEGGGKDNISLIAVYIKPPE